MIKQHHYSLQVEWTGNTGQGTSSYRSYERSHTISMEGRPDLECSSDPVFRGDASRYSPENLLVGSLSGCHMLWYLHLCAEAGVVVTQYVDNPSAIMIETEDGSGQFTEVTLMPAVTVAEQSMIDKANELHKQANELCFIARSVNFPVHHKPTCKSLQ